MRTPCQGPRCPRTNNLPYYQDLETAKHFCNTCWTNLSSQTTPNGIVVKRIGFALSLEKMVELEVPGVAIPELSSQYETIEGIEGRDAEMQNADKSPSDVSGVRKRVGSMDVDSPDHAAMEVDA